MKNRKGAIYHWILFGVILAVGMFVIYVTDVVSVIKPGMWSSVYQKNFLQAERDLLLQDVEMQSKVTKLSQELNTKDDLGCGDFQGVALLNKGGTICKLYDPEMFLESIKEKIKDFHLSLDGNDLVGKSGNKLVSLSSNAQYIPTEIANAQLFKYYQRLALRPFSSSYSYNSGFRIRAGWLEDRQKMENVAIDLLNSCRNQKKLPECLKNKKPTGWNYGKCGSETTDLQQQGRQIIFCIDSPSGYKIPGALSTASLAKYDLAIDFSPERPFAVEDITVVNIANTNFYEVSFSYDDTADAFNVYYTTESSALEDYQGTVEDIYLLQDQLFEKINVRYLEIKTVGCENKEKNTAYLCDGRVYYVFDNPDLISGNDYLFTATAVDDDKESLISGFKSIAK